MLDGHFNLLLRRIKLTKVQNKDLETKMNGVARCLHGAYYESKYDGATKYLIGSVGKKTNIRPPKDIDILFKIPKARSKDSANTKRTARALFSKKSVLSSTRDTP